MPERIGPSSPTPPFSGVNSLWKTLGVYCIFFSRPLFEDDLEIYISGGKIYDPWMIIWGWAGDVFISFMGSDFDAPKSPWNHNKQTGFSDMFTKWFQFSIPVWRLFLAACNQLMIRSISWVRKQEWRKFHVAPRFHSNVSEWKASVLTRNRPSVAARGKNTLFWSNLQAIPGNPCGLEP